VAKLVIFRGDSVENELHLGRQTVRIGRDARNDIVLDDKTVTRFHAEVIPEGGTYYIADMNSRNGVWMNNQRIKGKTPLALGVPVTVGAYEVTLEDDVGTSDLSDLVPAGNRTVVSTAVAAPEKSSGSTSRGRAAPGAVATAATKPAVFWAGIGVGTLVLCLATYLVVRRFTHPAPPPIVAVVPPPAATEPLPTTTTAPPTPLTSEIVAGYLEAAQYAIADKDYQAARDDVEAALELDPGNADLIAKKKEIGDLVAAAAAPPPPKVVIPKAPEVVEVSGIPRRPGETPVDYNARADRVRSNLREGMKNLDAEEFTAAITRFQAVERDQKGYMNVDALLSDAQTRQKAAVDKAISNGQENERQNNLVNAVRWYENALRTDPSSAAAQERLNAVADRRLKQGLDALRDAEVLRKRNDIAKAVAKYQEAAYLLPSTNEKKAEAQQWVEKLKP
jgi:pSer/pThr/pTyr-binding forkhead associated (FHA) protein